MLFALAGKGCGSVIHWFSLSLTFGFCLNKDDFFFSAIADMELSGRSLLGPLGTDFYC